MQRVWVFLLSFSLCAEVYDFSNLSESSSVTEEKSQKKDYVSADEVFALFKGEQKVTIVSKKEERIQDAPATVYVVTDKEIEERGYLFLHDLLRDVPGIDFINDLGVYGMIAMQRGIDTPENNKTLIFVDGVLTNNPSQGVSYMSYQFALHNVKRVEILWGPASALYGANAFAGVINIVTKSSSDLKGSVGQLSLGTLVPKITRQLAPGGIYLDFLAGGSLTGEEGGPTVVVSGNYLYSQSGLDYGRRHLPMSWAPSPQTDYYIPENAMPRLGDYQAMAKFEYAGFTLGLRAWHILSKQGGFATHNYMNAHLSYWGHQGQEAYLKFQKSLLSWLSHQSILAARFSQMPNTPDPNLRVGDADRSAYGDNQGGEFLFYKRNDYALSYDHQWSFDWTNSINTTVGFFYEYAKVSNWNTNDTSLRKWDGSAFVQRYPDEKKATFNGAGQITAYGVGPNEKAEVYYNQQNAAVYLQQTVNFFERLKLIAGGRGDYLLLKGIENPEVLGTTSNCTAPCTLQNTLFATDADAAAAGAVLKRSNIYYKVSPVNIPVFSFNPSLFLTQHQNIP